MDVEGLVASAMVRTRANDDDEEDGGAAVAAARRSMDGRADGGQRASMDMGGGAKGKGQDNDDNSSVASSAD